MNIFYRSTYLFYLHAVVYKVLLITEYFSNEKSIQAINRFPLIQTKRNKNNDIEILFEIKLVS